MTAIVVGGGLAGLLAARRLAAAGEHVVLVEARDRLGGTLARVDVAGLPLDAGAESFATRGGVVERLVGELGLAGDLVTPDAGPAWLAPADRPAVPLPATGLLGIPAHPLAPDVVAAIGRRAALRAALDGVLPGRIGRDAASLGELVARRMGRRVLTRLVAPVTAGVHSADPRSLAVDRVAPGLRDAIGREGGLARAVGTLRAAAPAGAPVAGLAGGVHRLADALAADLGDVDIRLGATADDLAPDGVRVGRDRIAGRVVLAAAPRAERRVHLTTLVVDAPELDAAPRGTGVLAAGASPARALTHATAKWRWLRDLAGPGRHVLRLSSEAPLDDAAALAAAERLLGLRLPRPVAIARAEWSRAAPALERGIPLVGEAVAGTGIANVVRHTESRVAELLPGIAPVERNAP